MAIGNLYFKFLKSKKKKKGNLYSLCFVNDHFHVMHGCIETVLAVFNDEYGANENSLKNSEKIAYVGQRLMYPIIKTKKNLPCQLLL